MSCGVFGVWNQRRDGANRSETIGLTCRELKDAKVTRRSSTRRILAGNRNTVERYISTRHFRRHIYVDEIFFS